MNPPVTTIVNPQFTGRRSKAMNHMGSLVVTFTIVQPE